MTTIFNAPTYRIWPGLAPGETTEEPGFLGDCSNNVARVTGVTAPELHMYGAEPGESKPCVMVCPGGGYSILAADLEGSEVAEWLVGLGFVAAVLYYRCPDKRDAAYQDGRRAISWLRAHVADFGIDPERLGVLGYSAGGHLVTRLAANDGERPYQAIDDIDTFDCRPSFSMPIYPAYLISKETGVAEPNVAPTPALPPLFLAQTADDAHFCSAAYAEFAQAAGVDVTSKVYATGGHGYGLRAAADVPASRWPVDAAKWLQRWTKK